MNFVPQSKCGLLQLKDLMADAPVDEELSDGACNPRTQTCLVPCFLATWLRLHVLRGHELLLDGFVRHSLQPVTHRYTSEALDSVYYCTKTYECKLNVNDDKYDACKTAIINISGSEILPRGLWRVTAAILVSVCYASRVVRSTPYMLAIRMNVILSVKIAHGLFWLDLTHLF
jgi:hypothetical protein